ncbi:hypothetical protein OG322_23565 [Streptomyces sp. NBC_01260]|uniref:hypothetical protein n=1 Tax=Streptomyces sp. NBC_01260 TaxID=2903801 RepID=UPI002E2F73A0|nr:hypothetical protein [Streptomyces sp. NBC_01260]
MFAHRRPIGTRRQGGSALRRAVALGATTLLVWTGGSAALAPLAHAGTVTPTVHCTLPAGQGEATGPQEMNVVLTPDVVDPGGKVHAKVTLGPSPATSGLSLSDVPTTPSIDLAMSGGATGTVTVTGPQVSLDVPSGKPIEIPPYEGDFIIPANASGPISFTPLRNLTRTKVLGSNYETPCVVTSGGGSIGTVTAEGSAGQPATLIAPTTPVRPSTPVTLAGSRWTPSATPVPSLCAADGGGCDPAKFAGSSLAINGSGQLTGSAVLAGAGAVPDGSYLVKVGDGTKEATAPLTVRAFVPDGSRAIALSRGSGPVGSVIAVTGSNYFQDRWINTVGLDASGATLDDTAVYVKSGPDGKFSVDFTVSDPAIAAIQVDEGNDPATVLTTPFTVTEATATLSAGTAKVKPGGAIGVSGGGWPSGVTPAAALCAADGSGCDAARISGSTLRIAADGTLAGTVTVAGATPRAVHALRVTAGGSQALTQLTVSPTFVVLTPATGPKGTAVTVLGQGFAKVATVSIVGLRANGSQTSDPVRTKVVGLDGAFSQTFTVNAADTVAIRVREVLVNPRTETAAFTVQDGTAPAGASFALSPPEGPVGTVVQVTGRGFAPVATVSVTGRTADGKQTADSYVTRIIGLDGTFALNFTVRDPATKSIRACEVLVNGKTVQQLFTVS